MLRYCLAVMLALASTAASVPRWSVYTVELRGSSQHSNPFDVFCPATVVGPSGSAIAPLNVTLFYNGSGMWSLRFSPDMVGHWTWEVACHEDSALDGQKGSVECTPASSTSRGGVIIKNGKFFSEDGSGFLPVALESDWVWALGAEDRGMEQFIEHLHTYGFNYLLIGLYAETTAGNPFPDRQAPRVSPTSRTPWASSDQLTLDLAFYQNTDRMLELMAARGMVTHLFHYVGNKPDTSYFPKRGSKADDLFWKYALARFNAFNVVLDVSKEAGGYGVGNDYIEGRLKLMHAMNVHKRLITAHSGLSWTNNCDLCDFNTRQKHFSGDISQQEGHYYGDMLVARRAHGTVLQAEFFYEHGEVAGCHESCCHGCAQSSSDKDIMRRVMWDHYMAGACGTWYQCDMSWDIIVTNTSSVGMSWVKHLSDFWAQTKYHAMEPHNELLSAISNNATVRAMATSPPNHIVVHVRTPHASFEVEGSKGMIATWFDPTTGQTSPATSSTGAFQQPSSVHSEAILLLNMK